MTIAVIGIGANTHFAWYFHPSSRERVHNTYPGLIIARADPHSSLRSTFQESRIHARFKKVSPPSTGFGTASFRRLYNHEASHCVFLITINAPGCGKPLLTVPRQCDTFTSRVRASLFFCRSRMYLREIAAYFGGFLIYSIDGLLLFSFECEDSVSA